MSECFGCKHLKFNDLDPDFGYWACQRRPGSREQPHQIVGMVGSLKEKLVCEPPKQVCDGEWEYYL